MLTQQPFYFASIRKLVVGFGSLFDNISIVRYSGTGANGSKLMTIPVPLSYGPHEKWLRIQKEDRREGTTKIKTSYPRMSFEITNLQYDSNRQLNRKNKTTAPKNLTPDEFLAQLQPAPWDVSFDLHIGVKNIEDGLQIVEQILPYFQPSFNLPIKIVPDMNTVLDVPVIFSGINFQDSYEGSFEENRVIIITLSFVAKGAIYPPISGKDGNGIAIIKKVITGLYGNKEMTDPFIEQITVAVDPIDASIDEPYDIVTTIE